jgi:hypothetical protein
MKVQECSLDHLKKAEPFLTLPCNVIPRNN